jgi:anaerobic ribonucleoside-triphosphate reductase activating protein
MNGMQATHCAQVRLSSPPEQMTVGHHSGPGLRMIFWVQGCSLLCTRNCLNPHLLKRDGGFPVEARRLTGTLLRLSRDYSEVEGVTVLGGEPMDQADGLAEALAPIREASLSIMIYTGHTLEWLRASSESGVARLLGLCDILVDGPFMDELYDEDLIWRGSRNQRILLLSDRYSEGDIERALDAQKRALSLSASAMGDWVISGAQSIETGRRLRQLTQIEWARNREAR